MTLPEKFRNLPGQPVSREHWIDRMFFGAGTLAAIWLAWALLDAERGWSWRWLPVLVLFWLVLAYLALPRLNRILTGIYVPDYFIGRTRTSDGLLGDPLNLAFRGSGAQLSAAFAKAGWVKADPVDLRSSVGIVLATLTRRSYAEAPVSPLLLFGRPQDAAFQQEVEGNPAQRHHVRVWRTPPGWLLPGGHRVDWLAGGTYDRAVGLSLFTLQVTHKIDADIDVERDHIVTSITTAEPATTVEPLVDFTTGYHSRNGGGDVVHTDGTLPVVDLTGAPTGDDELLPPVLTRMPLQVALPGVLALVFGPLVAWQAWVGDGGDVDRMWAVLSVGLALFSTGAAGLMLARSALARRALLVLSLVAVILRIAEYAVLDADAARWTVLGHAAEAVLLLVALSSPAASAWCGGRPIEPE